MPLGRQRQENQVSLRPTRISETLSQKKKKKKEKKEKRRGKEERKEKKRMAAMQTSFSDENRVKEIVDELT